MTFKKYPTIFWFAFGSVVVGLLLLAWLPLPTHAGPSLPVRVTPTPVPPPADDEDEAADAHTGGAHIELHIPSAPTGAWAVVQWQDSAGDWHDVEGWQGMLGADGKTAWWVAAKDFGTGPFRWVITQGEGGEWLGVSQSFNLPSTPYETMRVEVPMQP